MSMEPPAYDASTRPPSYNAATRSGSKQSARGPAANEHQTEAVPLRDCTVSFAIDSSSSTVGDILYEEKRLIASIAARMTDVARCQSIVMPWNSLPQDLLLLDPNTIESSGVSAPDLLLESPVCRQLLQDSDVWMLLTSGCITDRNLNYFAKAVAKHHLHGTPCIVVTFGARPEKPADCDIGLGVSIFAAVPDALVLYFDTKSKILFLLQCSGHFTRLLTARRGKQPKLTEDTAWTDLPRLTFADLACVTIPKPKNLAADEILLPDGLLLNLEDIWCGHCEDEETLDRILGNENNLNSILLTARARGDSARVKAWLKTFAVESSLTVYESIHQEKQAVKPISEIVDEIQSGASGKRLQVLQSSLRQSYAQNFTSSAATSAHDRRELSRAALQRLSQGGPLRAGALSSLFDCNCGLESDMHMLRRALSLMIPTFKTSTTSSDVFTGECCFCGDLETPLAILLRKPSTETNIPEFIEPSSVTFESYPLAAGNTPETDIISPSVCCMYCSYYLVNRSQTPLAEKLTCVLPLVTISRNREAYREQLTLALGHRFHEREVLLVFLSVAVNTYSRLSSMKTGDVARRAMKWICKDLLHHVYCTTDDFGRVESDDGGDHGNEYRIPSATSTLEDLFTSAFEYYCGVNMLTQKGTSTIAADLFEYPLPGFMVMVLALHLAGETPSLPHGVQNIVWQRFLYQITQKYCQKEIKAGDQELPYNDFGQMVTTQQSQLHPSNSVSKTAQVNAYVELSTTIQFRSSVKYAEVLLEHELLSRDDLASLHMLPEGFGWIWQRARSAVQTYLNTLRAAHIQNEDAWTLFDRLRQDESLQRIFLKPLAVMA